MRGKTGHGIIGTENGNEGRLGYLSLFGFGNGRAYLPLDGFFAQPSFGTFIPRDFAKAGPIQIDFA